ncbi:hypothetical protein KI387_001683, partial [Taxus chinensis]
VGCVWDSLMRASDGPVRSVQDTKSFPAVGANDKSMVGLREATMTALLLVLVRTREVADGPDVLEMLQLTKGMRVGAEDKVDVEATFLHEARFMCQHLPPSGLLLM